VGKGEGVMAKKKSTKKVTKRDAFIKKVKEQLTPKQLISTGVALLLLVAVVSAVRPQPESVAVNNDERTEQRETETESTEETQAEENQEAREGEATVYEYTAQPGDSYTLIARKAVQTYGLKNEVDLSKAQIIYAETNLVRAAGSPELNVGSVVTVDEITVQQWVERAGELSAEAQTEWEMYARYAEFNTDNVGEARE
jgi:hypothetical protein